MRIGIILHGPEIVDMGSAKRITDIFRIEHEVMAKLGGTMGRTAVLDAGLEDVIDISQGLTPSETINALKDSIDLAILLNHGKTLDTGRHFGKIVASKINKSLPFVHIERPDDAGRIVYYDPKGKRCAEFVRRTLMKYDETYDLPIEPGSPLPSYVRIEGDIVVRQISGAFVGENVRVDGIVIGEVADSILELGCRDGKIVELRGVKVKPHGLEKLERRNIDLFTAKVKTGNIRRTKQKPRVKKSTRTTKGKIAIIDHCAESTFELVKDAGLVITVGDDTTTIAADILTRLGIPVIGIIDGDIDGVLEDSVVPAGSVIIRVRHGFDDIVGREVSGMLEQSGESDELLTRILALAEKYIVDVMYY